MKWYEKASFILVSIILLSCNGNNSVRNQEHADVDSAVIDTMDVQPLKDESHKKFGKEQYCRPYCRNIILLSHSRYTYVFLSDKTGYFTVQGGSPSDFTWKRSGKNVTIVYEVFGKQKLKFDSKAQTLTEESESLGTLVFDKQYVSFTYINITNMKTTLSFLAIVAISIGCVFSSCQSKVNNPSHNELDSTKTSVEEVDSSYHCPAKTKRGRESGRSRKSSKAERGIGKIG